MKLKINYITLLAFFSYLLTTSCTLMSSGFPTYICADATVTTAAAGSSQIVYQWNAVALMSPFQPFLYLDSYWDGQYDLNAYSLTNLETALYLMFPKPSL